MLSVGVIGTGNISRAHLHACLELPQEVQVVARADIESAKAETARTEFALDGARVYEDAASMLAAEQLAEPEGEHVELPGLPVRVARTCPGTSVAIAARAVLTVAGASSGIGRGRCRVPHLQDLATSGISRRTRW